MYCKRPLQLAELSVAVTIDPPDEYFNDQNMISGATLLKHCGSLVRFSAETNVVQLSHFSVRQYFTTEWLADGVRNLYFMDELHGNGELMETCLKCLSFPQFDKIPVGVDPELDQPNDSLPPTLEQLRRMQQRARLTIRKDLLSYCNRFLEYAILNWPLHGRVVESTSDEYRSHILAFLADTPVLDNKDMRCRWAIQFCELQKMHHGAPDVDHVNSLYFLAWFGFVTSLRITVARRPKFNEYTTAELGHALLAAAFAGETEAVQFLLDANAAVATVDLNGESALHFAAREDHVDVVRSLLVDSRTDANSKCQLGLTPLHCATMSGSTECVKLLLEGGADVNSRDNRGDTVLSSAVKRDNMEIVKLLLKHNADTSIPGQKLDTPMHQAAHWGSTEVVKMLLEAGGDVSLQNLLKARPLHLAIDNNSVEVVQLLKAAEETLLNSCMDNTTILRLQEQPAEYSTIIVDKETREMHYTGLIFKKPPTESSQFDTATRLFRFPEPLCDAVNCSVCKGMYM